MIRRAAMHCAAVLCAALLLPLLLATPALAVGDRDAGNAAAATTDNSNATSSNSTSASPSPQESNATQVAAEVASPEKKSWTDGFDLQLGGHVKLYGSMGYALPDSILGQQTQSALLDGQAELRLKANLYYENWAAFEAHFENFLVGGDTRRISSQLSGSGGGASTAGSSTRGLGLGTAINDDRRFMDLTWFIEENDDLYIQQRFDRLNLSLMPLSGPIRMIRLGRQAVTWGNGFLFNPMDLLNPFAPTDVIRDYKLGDDLAYVQADAGIGGLELVGVPRRDPDSHKVLWDDASLGGKLHATWQDIEWDLMAAKHYQDFVLGLGATGYWGDAAWRTSATWTFLHEESRGRYGYLALVANMDYSWVWFGKNWYGYVEAYLNTLADTNYPATLDDPVYTERIARGELFTLGPVYVATNLNVELHPLLNFYVTTIVNAADPSALFQPRFVWSITDNIDMLLGGNIAAGARRTEYGGVVPTGADFDLRPPDSVYCWLSYYF
ncbi:hypothetical protein DQK91_16875 [Oceanidesulfovibrio marinus]|uniref:Alginate export domain-containing protein n=2 Tax=Oceanidesulfovibrio marinus TaxID=370038 RepID=A0A6P1ZD17_9BACT|nr:hypothetical protein DQK91_16875 [Oceanidesulfovibrio marinus]